MNRYLIGRVFVVVLLYCGLALALDPPPAYVKHCAPCHSADGSGRASSAIGKIPDLRSKTIASLSDAELFNAIAKYVRALQSSFTGAAAKANSSR